MKSRISILLVVCLCVLLAACHMNCEHQYKQEITTPASCTEQGIMTFTCELCEDAYTEAIPVVDHGYTRQVTKEPTCVEEGVVTDTCVYCGEAKTEPIAVIEHTYSEAVVTKEPTCAETGEQTSTCTVCGEKKNDLVGELGHDWVDATCVKAKHCARCEETEGEALGHTTKHGNCSRCGEIVANFNGTYWSFGFGQTLGSNYTAKTKSNGTFLAYNHGSGMFERGTYRFSDGKLYITIDSWKNIPFQIDGDGFISVKQYEMMAGKDYYRIYPGGADGKRIFDTEYSEYQKMENAKKTFLNMAQPLVDIVGNIKGKDLPDAEAIYGEAKLIVYEPSMEEYRFEKTNVPFEIYYTGNIVHISVSVEDMGLTETEKQQLEDALTLLFPDGSNYQNVITVKAKDGSTIEVFFIGFTGEKMLDGAEFCWND